MGKTEEIPVIWLQAAGCTGCAISVMNAEYPDIGNLLLDELVPGKGLAFRFQATLMGPTGRPALEVLERIPKAQAGEYHLVVEGAIPTAEGAPERPLRGLPRWYVRGGAGATLRLADCLRAPKEARPP